MVCAILGLVSIIYYKRLSDNPKLFPFYTLFSPHSWMGILTLLLWLFQLSFGIYFFLIFKVSTTENELKKQKMKSIHDFIGIFFNTIFCEDSIYSKFSKF